jgi:hypothetical protein
MRDEVAIDERLDLNVANEQLCCVSARDVLQAECENRIDGLGFESPWLPVDDELDREDQYPEKEIDSFSRRNTSFT